MQILIVIVTGVLTFCNYLWRVGADASLPHALTLVAQIVLTIVTLAILMTYKGKRTRPSFKYNGTRIFTFGFALVVLSTLGNVSVLVVFVLSGLGMIQGL